MRVVVDTNVAVSGLLWGGPPNQILKWAREGTLTVLTCMETASELKRILKYERLSRRMKTLGVGREDVFAYFMNLAVFVPGPQAIPTRVAEDPFDNLFLAIASENRAKLIISGDRHLLEVKVHENIEIVSPSEACDVIGHILASRK